MLGLLMKCSLRPRSRRGPAAGARPPARNNNAAEVKQRAARAPRPAVQRHLHSARAARVPAAAETAAAQRARPGRGGRGRAGSMQLITRCLPGDQRPPNLCPTVRQLRSASGLTLKKTWTPRASSVTRARIHLGSQIRLYMAITPTPFSFEPLTESKIPFGACSWSWGKINPVNGKVLLLSSVTIYPPSSVSCRL